VAAGRQPGTGLVDNGAGCLHTMGAPPGGPEMPGDRTQAIRTILHEHGRLAVDVTALDDHSDLYDAGLTSHASVTLMLALEEHFAIEFPERMLRRRTFTSIAAIRAGLDELIGADA
jgi:acyl carrier protein